MSDDRLALLAMPHIRLSGEVDQAMYRDFCDQLGKASGEGAIVVALSTLGGDPDVARAMADDVRLLQERSGRELLFLGKAVVYSAGATFMAAFPVERRYLTRGTRLLLHERKLTEMLGLDGPLRSALAKVEAMLHEIEESIRIEEEGFRALIAGSRVSFETLREKAGASWYIEAEDAHDLGLVHDVI
jgi:ATP-dependent protease ClpP protease subunit